MIYLNQYTHRQSVTPAQLDQLLANGWRHFGTAFFRYSLLIDGGKIQQVVPLRIRLADFELSSSQRRVLARNRDTRLHIRPTTIDRARRELFDRHKQRFANNIPESIDDFLSPEPATVPCRNEELGVCLDQTAPDDNSGAPGGRLIAASFLDLGQQAASAVYAMFEPDQAARSLGIYLILRGIDYAKERGLKYYYPGYAYREPSFYDYKKRFSALEAYDWQGRWRPFTQKEI